MNIVDFMKLSQYRIRLTYKHSQFGTWPITLCNTPHSSTIPNPFHTYPTAPSSRPYDLLEIPTSHATGFLKNPSLVSISPCIRTALYRLTHVAAIIRSCISARFLPTHDRGP